VVVGATAAPTATITITDSSVTPARVRVDAEGSVTWRNTGTRSHRVTSDTTVFAPFTLAPNRTRTVRFVKRTGRHPYRIDGRRCGVVFVGVPLGAGCQAGGGSGGGGARRPPTGTKTYRYDVSIRGEATSRIGEESGVEVVRRSQKWTGTLRNVAVTVTAAGSTFYASGASPNWRLAATVTESWRWFWKSLLKVEVNCTGTATAAVNLTLVVSANSGRPSFSLHAGAASPKAISDRQLADCEGRSLPPFYSAEVTSGDLKVSGSGSPPNVVIERSTGGLASPVGELVTGRAFAIDTRTFVVNVPEQGRQDTYRYVVRFTPRR